MTDKRAKRQCKLELMKMNINQQKEDAEASVGK